MKTWDTYLIGSLRNPRVIEVHKALTSRGISVFSQWFAAGPEADDKWKEYHEALGENYWDALASDHAHTIFKFDKDHLEASRSAVLVLPAGRSGHLELGYQLGRGKPGWVLAEDFTDRWDVMYLFANGVYLAETELAEVMLYTLRGDSLK